MEKHFHPLDSPHIAHYLPSPHIDKIMRELVDLYSPASVFLYNQRVSVAGETSGFKLCVVISTEDKCAAELEMYLALDCDVPFDLILYTPEEWEYLCKQSNSFAQRIAKTGLMLYG